MDSGYPIATDKEEMIMKKTEKADNNRPLDTEALTLEQIEKASGGADKDAAGFNVPNFNSADYKGSSIKSDGIK